MAEKYVNYVNLSDGTDLLDLRRDTITEDDLRYGVTAHDATGKPIVGTLVAEESNIVDSGQCGENVYWKLYDNGALYIYGEGNMYDYNDIVESPFPPDKTYHLIIEEGVTNIGSWCFVVSENLTTIIIGNTVKSIGEKAFADNLGLTSMVIPDNVEFIGKGAFEWCSNITSVTIGSGVTNISESAFGGCENLTDVLYKGSKEEWEQLSIGDGNEYLLNATLHCEYDPNADTVDGWNIDVRLDGSDPEYTTKPTISFVFSVG